MADTQVATGSDTSSAGDGLTRDIGFFGLLLTSEGSIIGSGWLFGALADGMRVAAGPTTLEVIHTPGHSPGGCCLHDSHGGVLFSGDTLFHGGPGATGRSYSDFDTIIASIRDRLLPLPDATRVLTGHGDETTIGDEAPHLGEWVRAHG